jgi:hypothetical protein
VNAGLGVLGDLCPFSSQFIHSAYISWVLYCYQFSLLWRSIDVKVFKFWDSKYIYRFSQALPQHTLDHVWYRTLSRSVKRKPNPSDILKSQLALAPRWLEFPVGYTL